MAYYNNPIYGYYPQVQQMLPVMYPQQQAVEQPQQQQNNAPMDSYMVWVQGKAGAQSYPVARGTTYDRNGYSRMDNREALLNHLQEAMDMASDEKDKKAVSRLMEQMSNRN